jgi:hypothetical protein
MPDLVQFDLDDAGHRSVMVLALDDEPGTQRAGRGLDAVRRASETLESALAHARDAADVALRQFQDLATRPDEVELEFGVILTAEAGAVLARSTAEAHLTVRLAWKKGPE